MPPRHPKDPGPSKERGRRVSRARKTAGLTQKELGAVLGVHERTVQAWEHGVSSPYRHVPRLAELSGRLPEWLLWGGKGDSAERGEAVATREFGPMFGRLVKGVRGTFVFGGGVAAVVGEAVEVYEDCVCVEGHVTGGDDHRRDRFVVPLASIVYFRVG